MSFYDDWITKKNTEYEKKYIEMFLSSDDMSKNVFLTGTEAELGAAISVITSVPIQKYIEVIDQLTMDDTVKSDQVPQFSGFCNALYRLPEILEFAPDGLSFSEIGYQLAKSPNDAASTKYGENHSKLAEMLDIVEICNRPSNVKSTNLGKYLIKFTPDEKKDLVKRLLLRQYIVKKMLNAAGKGRCNYKDIVSELSKSTALRRRSNVNKLLDYVVEGTDLSERLKVINWNVD